MSISIYLEDLIPPKNNVIELFSDIVGHLQSSKHNVYEDIDYPMVLVK